MRRRELILLHRIGLPDLMLTSNSAARLGDPPRPRLPDGTSHRFEAADFFFSNVRGSAIPAFNWYQCLVLGFVKASGESWQKPLPQRGWDCTEYDVSMSLRVSEGKPFGFGDFGLFLEGFNDLFTKYKVPNLQFTMQMQNPGQEVIASGSVTYRTILQQGR